MTLPPSLADALRPTLPELAEATIAAIGREVEDYRRPLEGPFGRMLRGGVEQGLSRFVDAIAGSVPVQDVGDGTPYAELGRGEARAGRSLGALLGAYRIGARMAWERFAAASEEAGHEPQAIYALAGAIFSYIDAISALSADGYTDEQLRGADERARRRRALVRMLAREDVAPPEVADLAAVAGWPLRDAVAALVASAPSGEAADAERALSPLGADVLLAAEGPLLIGFVADPLAPGRRAALEGAAAGLVVALGPAVAPAAASRSLQRARLAHRVAEAGHIAGAGERLVAADEHLLTALLHGDAALAQDLAAAALAPLDTLADGARTRLVQTLRSWLDGPGQVQRVAEALGVHPQTVRYRVGQLRDLFGDALDDPDARFELAVALRVSE